MKNIGFIGAGSMGSMLIDGLIRETEITSEQLHIAVRSSELVPSYAIRWPHANITHFLSTLAEHCDVIFLCVKPMDIKSIVQEILPSLKKNTHLISVAACVFLADLTVLYPGPISRFIPSLTSEVNAGVSLVCHNAFVQDTQSQQLNTILNQISHVHTIDEADFEMATNLTSSAPGIFASLFSEFQKAGKSLCDLPEDVTESMVIETLYGTVKLLKENKLTLEEIISRGSTKEGITEEAVKDIQSTMPSFYDNIFKTMLKKYETINGRVKKQFEV